MLDKLDWFQSNKDLPELFIMRQDILKDIIMYNNTLMEIIDKKERYEILKINTILCKEMLAINERIRLIEWMNERNYNF